MGRQNLYQYYSGPTTFIRHLFTVFRCSLRRLSSLCYNRISVRKGFMQASRTSNSHVFRMGSMKKVR